MIKNEQGEEMVSFTLSPYQIFNYADTNTDYLVIWTKKYGPNEECILLACYDNATPNRWLDTKTEHELLEIMQKPDSLWIYKGYLTGSIFNLRKDKSDEKEHTD